MMGKSEMVIFKVYQSKIEDKNQQKKKLISIKTSQLIWKRESESESEWKQSISFSGRTKESEL